MDKLLIIGIETETGRHLGRYFCEHSDVLGVPRSTEKVATSCGIRRVSCSSQDSVRLLLRTGGITQVIYCGMASSSGWTRPLAETLPCSDTGELQAWSRGCSDAGIPFTLISSDQQFDGPWIFHTEDSESRARTLLAHSIRSQEEIVSAHEHSLIVRSHVCGFAPDSLLAHHLLKSNGNQTLSRLWYATPIYASRFARLLHGLIARQATGIYHLGGGERISHSQLRNRIDERFHLTSGDQITSSQTEELEASAPRETSLRCSKARRRLCEGLPTICDFLDDVAVDLDSGLAEELAEIRPQPAVKVA